MSSTGLNRPNLFLQLAILFGLVLVCLLLYQTILQVTLPAFYNISDVKTFLTSHGQKVEQPQATLYLQGLSAFFVFILPALLFSKVLRFKTASYFQLQRWPTTFQLFLTVLIMLSAILFTNIIVDLTQRIPLPQNLLWLREGNARINEIITSFFTVKSTGNFFLLTFVLAFLPALGEELFFRGIIQQFLIGMRISPLLAIVITGLFFSITHMEFDNFFGIWLMGIVLGWLFYYSQNLWVSITAHFLNNFGVVGLKYAFFSGFTAQDMSQVNAQSVVVSLAGGILMVLFLIWFRKRNLNTISFPETIDNSTID